MSFESIDDVNTPISSSPAPTPTPPFKSKGVKYFGARPATVSQFNGKSAVQTRIRPASSTVTKVGKVDIAKLFQGSSSASASTPPSLPPSGAASRMPSGPTGSPQMGSPRLSSHPPPTKMSPPQMQPPKQPWGQEDYPAPMEGQPHAAYGYSGWYMPQPEQMSPQQAPPNHTVAAELPSAGLTDLLTIQNPPSALTTARIIRDLSSVPYPDGVRKPSAELNIGAKDGKFRYDRTFLLQFMSICKEKPDMLPPLDDIGLEPAEGNFPMSRGGAGRRRASAPQCQASVSGSPPRLFGKAFNSFNMGMGSFGTNSSKADKRSATSMGSKCGAKRNDSNKASQHGSQCRQSRYPTFSSELESDISQSSEMSVSEAKEKIHQYKKEFFATRNLEEAELYFVELPAVHHYLLVDDLVYSSVESTEADARLVVDLFTRAASKGLCSPAAFEEGLALTAEFLDDIAIDAPSAPGLLAIMMKGAGMSDVRREKIAAKSQEYRAKLLELSKPHRLPFSFRRDTGIPDVGETSVMSSDARGFLSAPREREVKAQKELYQRQMMMSRGGSRRGGDRGDQQQVGPDGWTTAGSAPRAPPKAGDLSKFGQISKGSTARMTFGSQSTFSSGKKDKRESIERTNSSSQNIFSMLQNSEASAESSAPKAFAQRKKLVLAPRSKPVESTTAETEQGSDDEVESPTEESAAPEMAVADAKKKIEEDLKEFFAVRNLDEAEDYFSSLPASYHHLLVDKLVSFAIKSKEADAQLVGDLFARASSKGLCAPAAFEQGIASVAEFLDDIAIDAPKAPNLLAIMIQGADLSEEQRTQIASKLEGSGAKLLEHTSSARRVLFNHTML